MQVCFFFYVVSVLSAVAENLYLLLQEVFLDCFYILEEMSSKVDHVSVQMLNRNCSDVSLESVHNFTRPSIGYTQDWFSITKSFWNVITQIKYENFVIYSENCVCDF